MTTDEIWTVYGRLWGRCEGCGRGRDAPTLVRYLEPHEIPVGEAGYFRPGGAAQPRPEIAIVRQGCGPGDRSAPTRERQDGTPLDRDALLAELCNLAHELGHCRSWREGRRTEEYEAAVLAFDDGLPLVDRQQALVLEEEERAWEHARLELDLLGFTEWARFDAMRTCGMDAYRQTFWPTAR